MKKYLFGESGNFYKANLHCHTNWSDGSWTPEQVKQYYKDHGYSVVAYTDHDALIPHQDLKDGDFVYFVHSYYAATEPENIIAMTEYGAPLTAAAARGNVCGCQFHPEKSGEVGLKILKAFCEM